MHDGPARNRLLVSGPHHSGSLESLAPVSHSDVHSRPSPLSLSQITRASRSFGHSLDALSSLLAPLALSFKFAALLGSSALSPSLTTTRIFQVMSTPGFTQADVTHILRDNLHSFILEIACYFFYVAVYLYTIHAIASHCMYSTDGCAQILTCD